MIIQHYIKNMTYSPCKFQYTLKSLNMSIMHVQQEPAVLKYYINLWYIYGMLEVLKALLPSQEVHH